MHKKTDRKHFYQLHLAVRERARGKIFLYVTENCTPMRSKCSANVIAGGKDEDFNGDFSLHGDKWMLAAPVCHLRNLFKKLTYDSELGVGEHPAMPVLCHALVNADVRQVQAADRQHSIIHLKPVLLERCSTNVIIPELRRFVLCQPDDRQQTVSDKATSHQKPIWDLLVANCFIDC